jgi:hypothetical protein
MVPPQSWEFLGITVVGLLLVAVGIHYALRAEGIEDERRRELEEEEAIEEAERPPSRWAFLRRSQDEDEEPEEGEPGPRPPDGRSLLQRLRLRSGSAERSGGRPPPAVRRGDSKRRRRRGRSGSEDDDL